MHMLDARCQIESKPISCVRYCAYRTEISDDGMSAEMDLYFPRIFLTGAYKADSRYEGIKFSSKGVFNFTFSKCAFCGNETIISHHFIIIY